MRTVQGQSTQMEASGWKMGVGDLMHRSPAREMPLKMAGE